MSIHRRGRRSIAQLLAAVTLVSLAACLGGRAGSARQDPNIISTAEIEESHRAGVRDLYDLVNQRRPRWLRRHTERSLNLQTVILVYQNEVPLGGLDALQGYPLLSVLSLRFLDAAQANLLPGRGSSHLEGAIVIQTGNRAVPETPVH